MPVSDAKRERYEALVYARKACQLCAKHGLRNPSRYPKFDSDEIGPWSRWQGNLDAPLMVVGQDWGPAAVFERQEGGDSDTSQTSRNLRSLLSSIGHDVGPPGSPEGQDILFLTNAILCLRENVKAEDSELRAWSAHCRDPFLRQQIEIVSPKVVVALGEVAFNSVCGAYALRPPAFSAAVLSPVGIPLRTGTLLLATYHCGPQTVRTGTRSLEEQKLDWRRVGEALRYATTLVRLAR